MASMGLFNRIKQIRLFRRSGGKVDYYFTIGFAILVVFGLLVLSSASSVLSFQRYNNTYTYVTLQIVRVITGLCLLYAASLIDYHYWKKVAFPLLVISIILLVAVFIPGIGLSANGARRWIHVGPILFQPSEIVKLTFLLYIATWLSSKGEKVVQHLYYGFLPFIFLLTVVGGLIIAQKDMGSMTVVVAVPFIMYFVGGARLKHVFVAAAGAACAFFALIKISPYRAERLTTFLHPELNPLGAGYHINQALLAIGSGGILGRGFGHSRQKFAYLPEAMTDSIFAIISEELGLLFGVALISLYAFLALRGLHIARRAPDSFGRLIAVGVTSWFSLQAFVNIAAISGLMPLTGIPLPFVSYGGSSLIVLMMGVGILLNISRQGVAPRQRAL